MPTLEFKGKHIVYAHHLSVPYRTLDVVRKKSVPARGANASEGSLIIHGDNLDALKALMPRYAGRVNCIYIDPPYNTGNEGWCYNDNVNSELMRRWLAENGAVDGDDEERHEKWLCMMWPRLQLLRELLAEDGVIFISIDDNEQHRLRMMMDEIFGEDNFIAQIVAQTNPRGRSLRRDIAQTHEYALMYAKDLDTAKIHKIPKSEEALAQYNMSDEKGSYRLLRLRNTGIQFFNKETRPNLFFPIYVNPQNGDVALSEGNDFSVEVLPIAPDGRKGCWTWGKDKISNNPELIVGRKVRNDKWRIYRKDYLMGESLLTRTKSLLTDKGINHEVGRETLTELFSRAPFDFPKSPMFIESLIRLVCEDNGIILDSFAGSGTTAHAVLELNKQDGGNRRFILVECEDYADKVTAERVRRVIKGVRGAKNKALQEGLGGSFTFCTLGRELNIENLLRGKDLPDYDALARHVAYTATGVAMDKIKPGKDHYFGETADCRLHMIYRPEEEFLCSKESALTRDLAERIGKAARNKGKTAIVFAPWKFISQKDLSAEKVTFCQLPYAIHQLYGL